MAEKPGRRTVANLKALRDRLVDLRWREAYMISGAYHRERLDEIVRLHQAIAALDAVIAEGRDQPPPL